MYNKLYGSDIRYISENTQGKKKRGYSQDTVAQWLNVKRSAYTKKEKNMTPITVEELLLLCDRLGINPVTLFRDKNASVTYAEIVRDILLTMSEHRQKTVAEMLGWTAQGEQQRMEHSGEKKTSTKERGDR